MAKGIIGPITNEAEYDDAIKEIERYFDNEPKRGTSDAERFDLLAGVIKDYEERHWPIGPKPAD